MLVLGRAATDRAEARARARAAIASGEGLDRFRGIIENQGGDPRVIDEPARLPASAHRFIMTGDRSGYIARVDAGLVGRASVILGAGRDRVEDRVDPAVGIMVLAKPGDRIAAGDGLFELHYSESTRRDQAVSLLAQAVGVSDTPPAPFPLVVGEVQ